MIRERPVIETLDIAYQRRSGDWVTLNDRATKIEAQRGGKRSGVTNKIDVGTLSVQLAGALSVAQRQDLSPNTPVRVAARDGRPGGWLYELPTPVTADGWIRSTSGGLTLTPAIQNRPAVGDVPAGNRLSYGFTADGTVGGPYARELMTRQIWGGNFIPGRRYRISARAVDHVPANNAPIRLVASNASIPGRELLVLGKARTQNAYEYTEIPAIEFEFPAELATSYMYIGIGMSRAVAFGIGSTGTYQSFSLSEFRIDLLPLDPSSVITAKIADVVDRSDLDKNTGKVRTFTTITAVDAVQIHANTQRYGAVTDGGGGFETWENRVNRLAASAQAPVRVPKAQDVRTIYVANDATGWTALRPIPPIEEVDYWTLLPVRQSWPVPQGLWVRYKRAGAQSTYPAGTLGMERKLTGLTVGATYRVEAFAVCQPNSVGKSWRLGVAGLGSAAATVVPADPGYAPLTPYQFTATGTTHTLQVTNGAPVTLATGAETDVLVLALKAAQTAVPAPYMLQDIVFESDLASHFDLLSNSVGGRWWVDTHGITQLRQFTEAQQLAGTWTDNPAKVDIPGVFEYVDVDIAYDTRTIVTELTLDNKGRKVDEEGRASADDAGTTFRDLPASDRWGVRASSLATSLYAGQGFTDALDKRAAQIFGDRANTARTITGFRWNAQEDMAKALALDIYDLVAVERGTLPVLARISSLKHTITPTRWMVDVQLTDIRAGVPFERLNRAIGARTFAQLNAITGGRTFAELNDDPLKGLL